MIVADTNVTVQLFIAGVLSPSARRLFELDGTWLVPPVWPHEFLNVLATYGKSGGMPLSRCIANWRNAIGLFSGRIVPIDVEAALQLAVERRMSAYDAQFVSLAFERKAPCITEDRRLREAFPGLAFSIDGYLEKLTG